MSEDMDKKYCEDFCPIYPAIEKYNAEHIIKIQRCFGICEYIEDVVRKNNELLADKREF